MVINEHGEFTSYRESGSGRTGAESVTVDFFKAVQLSSAIESEDTCVASRYRVIFNPDSPDSGLAPLLMK